MSGSFNEAFEKRVGNMLMKNIRKEFRSDGEVAYTVTDLEGLVINVMEFIEDERKKIQN